MVRNFFKGLRNRREEIEHRIWNICIGDFQIWLSRPAVFFESDVDMKLWGEIQSRVLNDYLSKIVLHNHSPYIYIQYRPLNLAVSADSLKNSGVMCETSFDYEGQPILIFSDCNDPNLWATLLATDEIAPMSKFFCALDHQPSNWKSILSHYYSVTRQSFDESSYARLVSGLTEGLYLIGYSVDNDLVIEVPESDALIEITMEITKKYNLNPIYHKLKEKEEN